jgi:hypothetical protein
MKTIHKYPIKIEDHFTVMMPWHAQILCVQVQRDEPFIWALVDTRNSLVTRHFLLRGTGHDASEVAINDAKYVGTFQLHGGDLVFHLFDIPYPRDRED